jgi:nucleotide-binding universal stress UspA family protein
MAPSGSPGSFFPRSRCRDRRHSGEIADEVLRVAQEVDASVIVIGLRKRSPVGKLLMGSSAQRILLEADRPVLAVKS